MKLKVLWFPQIPCKPYEVEVQTPEEGYKIMNVLAYYDLFQFYHRIKGDYCNRGDLVMWDEERQEWEIWYDEETGLNIDEYMDEERELYDG